MYAHVHEIARAVSEEVVQALKLNKAAAAASFNYRHLWSVAMSVSLRPYCISGYYSLIVAALASSMRCRSNQNDDDERRSFQ